MSGGIGLVAGTRAAFEDDADELVHVVAHADRAAQRDLLRRVAADHRVLHVEVGPARVGPQQRFVPDAFRGELGPELAVGERLLDELRRKPLEKSSSRLTKREPDRLPFFDHRDLDAADERQLLALERRGDRHRLRRHRARRHVGRLAKAGIREQHDLRAAPVLAEHVGPGADRMRAEIAAVRLDDFARDRGGVRHREHVEEAQVGLLQADAQRVAIDDLEPRDRRVVVEFAGSSSALRAHLVRADDLAFDQPQPRALDRRIEQALERIRLIGGGQLARLALERRVGREEDSSLQLENVGRAAVFDRRHRLERPRHELHRPRQVVVVQHRLVDVIDDAVGARVGGELRIEAHFRAGEDDAQRLRRVGGESRARQASPARRRSRSPRTAMRSRLRAVSRRLAHRLRLRDHRAFPGVDYNRVLRRRAVHRRELRSVRPHPRHRLAHRRRAHARRRQRRPRPGRRRHGAAPAALSRRARCVAQGDRQRAARLGRAGGRALVRAGRREQCLRRDLLQQRRLHRHVRSRHDRRWSPRWRISAD